MIRSLLIANRGEIACRIARSCRALGIEVIAVASDPDLTARHARLADSVVRLAGSSAADTYLRIDALIDAARRTGADAVHPGYGFLAENAQFARAVEDAGLIWVGPSPNAIVEMGSKIASKETMRSAGVPVLPSTDRPDSHDAMAAAGVDLPLLLKASAGGGGRGMRIVHDHSQLAAALESARAEAAAAFGDPTVFAERYVERGRHIEVQIIADSHGDHRALFERECSIQRRHQKIIEEAPSPAVSAALRQDLCEAALLASRAVGYCGVGTVEFMVEGESGPFWFLEMNTRLQVEHPVTELITGLDLVELQLRIAEGAALGELLADMPSDPVGHAIEVRLTAEDPAAGYLPAAGIFSTFEIPDALDETHPVTGLRLDSGVEHGDAVSAFYDSMVAKVIAVAPTRDLAIRRLESVLARARVHGPTTNLAQLRSILDHPEFRAGNLWTGFLDDHPCTETARPTAVELAVVALAVERSPTTPWQPPPLSGLAARWRNVPAVDRVVEISHPFGTSRVHYRLERPVGPGAARTARITVDDEQLEVTVHHHSAHRAVIEHDSVITTYQVSLDGDRSTAGETTPISALIHHRHRSITVEVLPRFGTGESVAAGGTLTAPMPGAIARLHVAVGDHVAAGQRLVSLEAMKMEHEVAAPVDAVVTGVLVTVGEQVETGQRLLTIETGHEG